MSHRIALLVVSVFILSACPDTVDLGFGKATTFCGRFAENNTCGNIANQEIDVSEASNRKGFLEGKCLSSTSIPNACSNNDDVIVKNGYDCLVQNGFFNQCSDGNALNNINRKCASVGVISTACQKAIKSTFASGGSQGACTISGTIDSFQFTCTKDIASICIGGSICGGNSVKINSISIKKLTSTTGAGSAVGESVLTFEVKHTDGTMSTLTI